MSRATGSIVSTARTWLFWTHLAMGVVAGAAIFTMSVTGALLALQPQILEWLERDQRQVVVSEGARRLDPSALIGAATAGQKPPEALTLTVSADPAEAAMVTLGRDGVRYVDPYRGVMLGDGAPGARQVFRWLTEFHRWFASPAEWRTSARGVTGWSTAAFVVLIASGFVLWIPRKPGLSAFMRSMTPGWPATPKARHFNWHTVAGFWSAPVLLVLACSGVVLAFPWANRLLYTVAGTPLPLPQTQVRADARGGAPTPRAGGRSTESAPPDYSSVDRVWILAERQIASWSTIALRIQGRTDGPLSFTITDAAHWNPFARSQLTVSARTGEVLRWEPYNGISRGQRWRGWARFAHTGELGGIIGQLLAGIASATAALLVWTGLALALRRLRGSRPVTREPAVASTASTRIDRPGRAALTQTEQRS